MRLRYALALLLGGILGGCEAAPPSPLVGTWRDVPADSAFARQYTFSDDGTLWITMRRPAPLADTTYTATYAVERDSVLTLADAQGSEQFIAHVRGDTLILRDADGFSGRFYRHAE